MTLKREIKVIPANRDVIDAALKGVNGRAVAHTVASYDEVVAIVEGAARHMDARGVPVRARAGAVLRYTPAGPSARGYKYWVQSTNVTLRMASDGKTWRLVDAVSVEVRPTLGADREILLTRAGRDLHTHAMWTEFGLLRTPEEIEAERQADILAGIEDQMRREAREAAAVAARREEADMEDLAQLVA